MAIQDDPNESSFIADLAPQADPDHVTSPSHPGGLSAMADTNSTVRTDPSVPTTGTSVRRRSRSAVLAILVGTASLGTAVSTGCTTTSGLFNASRSSGFLDKSITKYRNRVAAEKAWHCRKDSFGAQADNDVFKAGFIDGYVDIAEGGKGCTPLVAPKKYWGWRYQSAAGQNAAGSWFGGYPLGVQAAEEDGLGTFRRLPFCDRPGRTGCGTPACSGAPAAPIGADGLPIVGDPMTLQSPLPMGIDADRDGNIGTDIKRLDGPAIEPSAGDVDPSMPPSSFDRSNPFNRGIKGSPENLRPSPNDTFEAAPPSPTSPIRTDSVVPPMPGGDSSPSGTIDDLTDAAPNTLSSPSDWNSDDLRDRRWDDVKEDQWNIDADPRVASLQSPEESGPAATTTGDQPPAVAGEVTIDEIFGLDDATDGGVEIQFDDLPFSFE